MELIDGEIVEMPPVGGRHVACVGRLTRLLIQRLSEDVVVNIQSPVQLGERDVLLLIEVSDTSLSYDRARKLPLYARAGIPESWLVDLQGEAIERHTNPVGDTYRITVRVGHGEEVASHAVPGLVLKADEVLG